MRITEERNDVVVGGAQSVDAFTIKASAKAFQILSSNLYSNPLGSMIRELSTNAYDAHIMVNKKEVPFNITLPNSLEPTFKIRDFGPGLSHNDIMNVYTTFFESTKTDSNDVVGCLGLGSKSPFGVADSFTVTSYFQGEKTIYSAFLNDARIPSIALFHKEMTEEENGIEIEVAISEDDFRVFNREVNQQLKYFKTKPNVSGNADFQWNVEEEYLYQGTNWKMVAGHNGNARVIQGQIQYPISTRDMGKVFDNAPAAIKELLSRSVLFEVNIGDVNIAPSREALSYDTRTSENIIKAAEKILEELPAQIVLAIQDQETEYEAKIKYAEIMDDLSRGYYSRNALSEELAKSGKILWKGKDVSSKDISIKKENIKHATQFNKNYNGRFQKSNMSAYRGWNKPADAEETWDFQARNLKNTMWVYATPTDKAVEGRAKQWANENYNSQVNMYIVTTELTAQKFANQLGLKKSHLVIASELPKVKKAAAAKKEDKTIYVQAFYRSAWNKSNQWETETVSDLMELEGYYVNLDRFDVSDKNGKKYSDLKSIVNGAIELKIISEKTPIYGLRTQNQKREHQLKDLFETIRTESKKITLGGKINFGDNDDVARKLQNDWTELDKLQNMVEASSPIKPIIDGLLATRNNKHSYDAEKLINMLDLKDSLTDMTAESTIADELYPMIAAGGYYMKAKVMATYIAQVDALMSLKGILPKM